MRLDSLGFFWEDTEKSRKRGEAVERPMPPIPETGWKKPDYLPNLSAAPCISIDLETWDPELIEHGPGWARGIGHIVGVSVCVPGLPAWYFPIRHETEPEDNLDPEIVLQWLRDTLSNPCQPKIGANIGYDVGWLRQEGVIVQGELIDVQYAEALLDERAKVGLDTLGVKYLTEGKESSLLYQWCADWFGGNPTDKQRKHIHKTPPRLCGPYAESDADLPLRIAGIQYGLLVKEGLYDLFRMECKLIYILMEMRFAGVTVDAVKAEELKITLTEKEAGYQSQLDEIAGRSGTDVNKKDHLVRIFDRYGIAYGKTATGKASVTKGFLEKLNHPVGALIRDIKKCQHLRGTFVESYILDSHIDGRVYCQFHPLRGDDNGTRSGRFSSSDPNLQNIPARDDELAPLIRGLFIPDAGHEAWRKYDYSQIEYRFLIHYAVGEGANNLRAHFNAHPETDYHDITQQLIKDQTGIALPRKPVKNINFGLLYGMGQALLCSQLGISRKEGKGLFAAYHSGAPFVKATMDACSQEARETGEIKTILGRKSRFDLWEPEKWDKNTVPLPYDQAIRQFAGPLRRSHSHKAINRRLQGSSADQLKTAMVQCWEDGVFTDIGVPRLTVHDELDFSDPGGKSEGFKELKRIMETCLKLRIPVKADGEIGPDWGHIKDID